MRKLHKGLSWTQPHMPLPSTDFLNFGVCWVFAAALGLSLAAARGATLRGSAQAYCGGFSSGGAQALGTQASVVVARVLSSCEARA